MEILTEQEPTEITSEQTFISFTFIVGENLHNRINKHVNKLKSTEGPGQSKQKWVIDAIKEKLNAENLSEDLPREKSLGLKISLNLHNQILKRVEMMRKVRSSFSKKQWIVEAIADKLDRDERLVQRNLNTLIS